MSRLATGQGHEVYFATIAANAIGADTTIIPADAVGTEKRKLRIFALVFFAKAAVTVTLKSGATAISGAMPLAINSGVSSVAAPSAHFLEVAAGQAFNINTSADGVYGWCAYTLEYR